MIAVLGWCFGLGITILAKMAIGKLYRHMQYRSFYRVYPQSAALTSLVMECWYIAVGGSYLLARIGQFLFAAAFWVGRNDVQFLSDDVAMLGYRLVSNFFYRSQSHA